MSQPLLVNTENGCISLVRYLYSRTRKLPVVVITQRRDHTGPCIKGPQLQDMLGPFAKVYTLSGGVQRCFNNLLDNFYGIEPSGVRLYVPRMTNNDYPSRHMVWNEYKITDFPAPEEFMAHLRGILQGRAHYKKNHTHQQKLLSPEEADAILSQAAPIFKRPLEPVRPRHQRSGRKVLTIVRPKPSSEQLQALCEKFAHA
jgi:hypothetical protein